MTPVRVFLIAILTTVVQIELSASAVAHTKHQQLTPNNGIFPTVAELYEARKSFRPVLEEATSFERRVNLPANLTDPNPGLTEQLLYGSIDLNALLAPYSTGTNSTLNLSSTLNGTFTVVNGTTVIINHAFLDSNATQDVISYVYMNTLNNQTNQITVNNHEIDNYYKVVNSNTNYITNIIRNNQTNILDIITLNNTSEIQPFLYIMQTQTQVVNDNGTQNANVLPIIESSSLSPVEFTYPPTNNTPIVIKYDYSGNAINITLNATGTAG